MDEERTKEIVEKEILTIIEKGDNHMYNKDYRKHIRTHFLCNELCCGKYKDINNKTFAKVIERLYSVIKNKKLSEHCLSELENNVDELNCVKLRTTYKSLLLLIYTAIEEVKELRKHLRDSNNYIFMNEGIEKYLNEKNISFLERGIQCNELFDSCFSNNAIHSFFFRSRFLRKPSKKYIYYESFEHYRILLICLKDIFYDSKMLMQLNNVAYYVELGDIEKKKFESDTCEIENEKHTEHSDVRLLIPSYMNEFYNNFKIKEEHLKHVQSLFHNSIPTVECVNMFINCLNENYSKIHKNKLFYKFELDNAYISLLPYVYCCKVQLIKYSDFLNLKETCQHIIKYNKIYDDFVNHLSSYIFEKFYFLVPFYTSYGKFIIIIKADKNGNNYSYDVLINSFIFPNESSFHAIIHFSHFFIKSLNSMLCNYDSLNAGMPMILYTALPDVDKQQILFPEIESQKSKSEIIVNMMFLIDSFFNNVKKMRVHLEFNQGLRFLYIIRLLEFYHEH